MDRGKDGEPLVFEYAAVDNTQPDLQLLAADMSNFFKSHLAEVGECLAAWVLIRHTVHIHR